MNQPPQRPPAVFGPCPMCHGVYGCAAAQWCYLRNAPRPTVNLSVSIPPKDTR